MIKDSTIAVVQFGLLRRWVLLCTLMQALASNQWFYTNQIAYLSSHRSPKEFSKDAIMGFILNLQKVRSNDDFNLMQS